MRIALAIALLIPVTAAADPKPSAAPAPAPVAVAQGRADDCALARKLHRDCVLDMSGETLEAGTPKNTGLDTTIVGFAQHTSLIRLRRDFIDQILKSADDL